MLSPVGTLLLAIRLVLAVEEALHLDGVAGDDGHGMGGRRARSPGRLFRFFGPRPPPRFGPVPRSRAVVAATGRRENTGGPVNLPSSLREFREKGFLLGVGEKKSIFRFLSILFRTILSRFRKVHNRFFNKKK